MYKKSLKIIVIFTILLCFNFSFVSYRANAVGAMETYINQTSTTQVSDAALKDLFGQTGYRVGSQADIDALRNEAKMKSPELVNKYPLFFGVVPDKIPVSDNFNSEYNDFCVKYNDGESSIYAKIGADFRSWVNKTVDDLSTNYSPDVVNTNNKTNYKITSTTFTIDYYNPMMGRSYTESVIVSNSSSIDVYTESGNNPNGTVYTNLFYVKHYKDGTIADPYQISASVPLPITFSVREYKDYVNPFKDYLPYPTTESETTPIKLPTEIAFPVKVDEDGNVTPQTPPLTFPSQKFVPDADGKTNTDSSIISYTVPETVPNTDPVTDPSTDTPSSPLDDIPTPKSESEIPQLNLKPLYVGVQDKFPFCIPWDFVKTLKSWNVSASEPDYVINFDPQYFKGGGSFHFNLKQFEKIILVIRYLCLLSYLYFLIKKSRAFIGNGGAA